ncbi:MAG: flagellar basal body L-ring protein FlgH [Rickettsiales bacterium]
MNKNTKTGTLRFITILSLSSFLTGCSAMLDKLENTYTQPPVAKVENPQQKAGYKPMTWPLPAPIQPERQMANSLWQPGARAFFRDQRAARVGDILRVNVKIDDKAQLDNKTDRKRDSKEEVQAPDVYGLEDKLGILTPGKPNPASLFDINGKNQNKGEGKIDRQEKIETQVAALITQVLPNGNFVIDGSQEIRVNYEIREVSVKGVIRPQDINSDNTIDSSQIAEARIIYGGRGQITDVQQPRWGAQVIDTLSPF